MRVNRRVVTRVRKKEPAENLKPAMKMRMRIKLGKQKETVCCKM